MTKFDSESPWGDQILPVDHDDFAEVAARTPQEEMAFAAEIPFLEELAREGTPNLKAEVIALNAAKYLAKNNERHAA